MADDPKDTDDVLSGLPRTRPQRTSARREAARAKSAKKAAAKPAKKAAAKPAKKAAKPAATAATRTPPVAAPRPVTPPARQAPPSPGPGVNDLPALALKAAGEVAGLYVKVAKGVLDRLPRP